MKKKRTLAGKIVCGALAAAMVISGSMMYAGASNYHDTEKTLSFFRGHWVDSTDPREKQDNTSVYVHCVSSPETFRVHAEGAYGKSGDYWDVSKQWYQISQGGTVRIINYIYENGCSWAKVIGDADDFDNDYDATIAWSPDSI